MVAYGFKKRFIDPIFSGLGYYEYINGQIPVPKRQTIRAIGKRRHARPGETIQLYTAMRTKQCRKLGDARCVSAKLINIQVDNDLLPVWINGEFIGDVPHDFARQDGFEDAHDMLAFWLKEHGTGLFKGVLIQWEAIDANKT